MDSNATLEPLPQEDTQPSTNSVENSSKQDVVQIENKPIYYERTEVTQSQAEIQKESEAQQVDKPNESNKDDDITFLKDKIKQLELKIAYYESEHQSHQNQLLAQRTQYEQQLNREQTQSKMLEEEKDKGEEEKTRLEQYQKMEARIVELEARVQERDQSIVQLSEKLQFLQDDYNTLHQQKGEQQIQALQSQLDQALQEQKRLEQANANLLQKLQNYDSDDNLVISIKCLPEDPRELSDLAITTEALLSLVQPSKRPDSQQESSKLQKLQKKLEELETYLQEKDRVILEQEQQLTELQDQLHEALKTEDSLKQQVRERQGKIDEISKEIKFIKESCELKIQDMQHQVKAKESSLQDSLNLISEKEIEIQRFMRQLREAEEAVKDYRARNQDLEDEYQQMQQRMQENQEEIDQIKADFEAVLNFKNELEVLIEEQTQHIEAKNKRMAMIEDTLRFKESELEKKESILRRMTQGADETKKRLSQAEMKLRQVTSTTLRDLKTKLKDKLNEIEVLKEMVKSSNKQAKAKDIDIQRLMKRIQRLEKMTELGKGIIQDGVGSQMPMDTSNAIIEEENEMASDMGGDAYITPLKNGGLPPQYINKPRNDPLGLNPLNYANQSVEDEVQMELLAAQNQRSFNIKGPQQQNTVGKKINMNYRNSKQKEIEEALELDRMLEQERRNQSQDVFQKKYDEKFEKYYNNVNQGHPANLKNNSSSIRSIFGGGFGSTDQTDTLRANGNDSNRYYEGMLPNLNITKKEQLEQELMQEINESMSRKDNNKYMTPNLQGKSKVVNKLNAAAYGKNNNGPYYHERNNNSKTRGQL